MQLGHSHFKSPPAVLIFKAGSADGADARGGDAQDLRLRQHLGGIQIAATEMTMRALGFAKQQRVQACRRGSPES